MQGSVFKPFGLVSHIIMKLKRTASHLQVTFEHIRKADWEVIIENKDIHHIVVATYIMLLIMT